MEAVFQSVFADINAFVYRCRNDRDYTMEFLAGGVADLIGYAPEDILQNKKTSFVGLVVEQDTERMFAQVDAAIEARKFWDITYRLTHKGGQHVWVRERGTAVYEGGALAYLQGLIVGAEAEFGLRTQLEQRVEDTRIASVDIVNLTQQITSSVKELSMLSVNARIEAARSGEAGKGFAVVANEIKTLADRNAVLANRIASQIGDINTL